MSTGYGSIYNMGKLQHRQNLLIVGGCAILVGTLMLLFSSRRSPTPQGLFAEAIEADDLVAMTRMLEDGSIDPNGRAPGNMHSWLRFAVNREAVGACELLLRKGADPAAPDGFPRTVLDYVKDPANQSKAIIQIRAIFESPPERDPVAPVAETGKSLVQELAELGRLKDSGLLNDEEYERAKARVLA